MQSIKTATAPVVTVVILNRVYGVRNANYAIVALPSMKTAQLPPVQFFVRNVPPIEEIIVPIADSVISTLEAGARNAANAKIVPPRVFIAVKKQARLSAKNVLLNRECTAPIARTATKAANTVLNVAFVQLVLIFVRLTSFA